MEKSKNNTRVEALKTPVPIDSVFVEETNQTADTKLAAVRSPASTVIKEPETEYRFDDGPNLAAINLLLAKHDDTVIESQTENVAESRSAEASLNSSTDLAQQEATSNTVVPVSEKDIAIMVVDEEVIQPKVAEPEAPVEAFTKKTGSKKIGKMDTVYELQQDRFLETLAKTANTEVEESSDIKRMKEAMRADRPLTITSAVKPEVESHENSKTEIVKVAAVETAGVIEPVKQSGKSTVQKTVIAKETLAKSKISQKKSPADINPDEIPLTRSELNNVLSLFMRSYNKGDIQRLMALFDDEATTNGQKNKQGIKSEYLELFETTSNRDIRIRNIQWDLGKGKAKGDAKFTVIVKPLGSTQTAQVEGKLEILAIKEKRGVFIKSLRHEVSVQ